MRNKKSILMLPILFLTLWILCSCDSGMNNLWMTMDLYSSQDSFTEITEKGFVQTSENDTAYFSIDASTSSYSSIRNSINNGLSLSPNMINIESMINYFNYDLPYNEDDTLTISAEGAVCPWNKDNYLLGIGLKTEEVVMSEQKNNIVFLLDISGSMYAKNKLGLLQNALKLFLDNIDDDATISVVTYASSDEVRLKGAKGIERKKISAVIEDLEAGGSTAGSKGIETAYEICEQYFIEGGNNRIILGTDGDFNVGISSQKELKEFISEKREEKGIELTILGFGMGNTKYNIMETLATNGNGRCYYIDSLFEARKVMVEEIGGSMVTVAKDVKASVTFNPETVTSYRLLGYENRMLTAEQFEDEETDAGEIGSGHELYVMFEVSLSSINTLDLFTTKIAYKDPKTDEAQLITNNFTTEIIKEQQSEDFIFASCVVEAALLMRDSQYKGDASYTHVMNVLESLPSVKSESCDPYRSEFYDLVEKYYTKIISAE